MLEKKVVVGGQDIGEIVKAVHRKERQILSPRVKTTRQPS